MKPAKAKGFFPIRDKLIAFAMKLLLMVTACFVIAVAVLGTIIARRQLGETRRWIENNLISKGRMLVANNAKALQGMALDNAFLSIQELIQGTVQEDHDVIYGIYMDQKRRPWAAIYADNVDRDAPDVMDDPVSRWAAASLWIAETSLVLDGMRVIEFCAPVMHDASRLGVIRYGLTTKQMEKVMHRATAGLLASLLQFAVAMLAICLIVFVWAALSARRQADALSRPIYELSKAVRDITRRNYAAPVKVTSNDEVGVLAQNFEEMRATIKDYTENLETKVEERTRQLDAAMIELKRSNTELEQFAYVASHDLQEPLRMVTSYMGLIEKRYAGALDEDAREFIGFAVDGAARMRRLINDLLMYSRVGTKGKPFAPVALEEALRAALKNLEVAISDRKAIVTHDPLPEVMADEGQMIQLFQNLIGNAIKFCNARDPRVHVAAARAGDRWEISVRDNGIGIAPENHERIFQIFQRLHARDEYEGTGIGLAVCKRIVERHNGAIRLESQVGVGTTFFFTLPLCATASNGGIAEVKTTNHGATANKTERK